MDESSYRDIAGHQRKLGCAFEKPILQRRAGCSRSRRVNIAEREIADCIDADCRRRCERFLNSVRQGSTFALGRPGSRLSCNQALQLQVGALDGLKKMLSGKASIEDIDGLIGKACERWGEPEAIPLETIIRSVAESRPARRVRKSKPRS